jgi:SiaC family regulatory phosphoprotein
MIAPELKIEGSKTQPAVTFKNGKLNIVGRSIPHDSRELYEPILQTLFFYSQNPEDITEINIHLEYLNSDSNRALMNVLVLVEKIYRKGKDVLIRWYYKNNDIVMYDQGNIFKSLIEVPFKFEPIN